MIRRLRIPGGYDPCYSTYTEEYFNRADVQSSLHAKISGNSRAKWRVCK
jgi:serine carboxypeptidase-like clade 2